MTYSLFSGASFLFKQSLLNPLVGSKQKKCYLFLCFPSCVVKMQLYIYIIITDLLGFCTAWMFFSFFSFSCCQCSANCPILRPQNGWWHWKPTTWKWNRWFVHMFSIYGFSNDFNNLIDCWKMSKNWGQLQFFDPVGNVQTWEHLNCTNQKVDTLAFLWSCWFRCLGLGMANFWCQWCSRINVRSKLSPEISASGGPWVEWLMRLLSANESTSVL